MWLSVECYALCIELLFKLYRATCRYCPSNTTMRKPDIRPDQTNAVRWIRAYHFIMFIFSYADTSKFRELWSPARQQIWPLSRSKVTVKVTTWYHRKGLVTRNTHAKYQSSICNSAKVMAKVKVFVTDGQRDGRTDRGTDRRMRFNVPTLSRKRGTKSTP